MPIVGVVENMGAFTAPDGQRWSFFGEGGGERLAADLGVPLLGSVPLAPAVSAGGDAGEPVTGDGAGGVAAEVFERITELLVSSICPPVDMGNCTARMDGPVPVTFGARR